MAWRWWALNSTHATTVVTWQGVHWRILVPVRTLCRLWGYQVTLWDKRLSAAGCVCLDALTCLSLRNPWPSVIGGGGAHITSSPASHIYKRTLVSFCESKPHPRQMCRVSSMFECYVHNLVELNMVEYHSYIREACILYPYPSSSFSTSASNSLLPDSSVPWMNQTINTFSPTVWLMEWHWNHLSKHDCTLHQTASVFTHE